MGTLTTPRQFTVNIPPADVTFFKGMIKRMGWGVVTKKKAKLSEVQLAMQEVENGEVHEAESVEQMFNDILGEGWRTE